MCAIGNLDLRRLIPIPCISVDQDIVPDRRSGTFVKENRKTPSCEDQVSFDQVPDACPGIPKGPQDPCKRAAVHEKGIVPDHGMADRGEVDPVACPAGGPQPVVSSYIFENAVRDQNPVCHRAVCMVPDPGNDIFKHAANNGCIQCFAVIMGVRVPFRSIDTVIAKLYGLKCPGVPSGMGRIIID